MYACHGSLSRWLALCLFSALPAVVQADVPPPEASSQVLIAGVPFICMREASALEAYVEFWTPSSRAAHMMVLRYYQPGAKTWDDYGKATDEQKGSLHEKWGDAKGLDELRALLSGGNPVIVLTATTPYAHELYATFAMMMAAGSRFGVSLQDLDARDYSSRVLGRMVGLDVHRKIGETIEATLKPENVRTSDGERPQAIHMNTLQEIATQCARVVVGIDPARRVVIVHDPAFGPAWEVPYEDFERMWAAADRSYHLLVPKDGARPSATTESAYSARTTDQRAAEYYVYGYSLAATGKAAEADEQYRAGLRLEGLSRGYRFMFLQERGYLAYRRKRAEQAISLLRLATEQIPQAPAPWFLMAAICRETGAAGGKSAADEFQKTADKLAGDQAGLQAGMKSFPDNLLSSAPLISLIPGPPPK